MNNAASKSSRASRRGIDDGGAVDELELVVTPVGAFGYLGLAVADRGLASECLSGIPGVEDELARLPVALVQLFQSL